MTQKDYEKIVAEYRRNEQGPTLSHTRSGLIILGQKMFDIIYTSPYYLNDESGVFPLIEFCGNKKYRLEFFITEDPAKDYYVLTEGNNRIEVSENSLNLVGDCIDMINNFHENFNIVLNILKKESIEETKRLWESNHLLNSYFIVNNVLDYNKVKKFLSKYNYNFVLFFPERYIVAINQEGQLEYYQFNELEKVKSKYKIKSL